MRSIASTEGSEGVDVAGLQDVGRLAWSDVLVLDEINYLCKLRKRKGLAAYCIPGRQYLSRKTGYAVRTVSRATGRLEAAGLIQKAQRRPVQGQWASNLYKPINKRFWRLAAALGKAFTPPGTQRRNASMNRGPLVAQKHTKSKKITLQKENKVAPQPSEREFSPSLAQRMPLLALWAKRGGG